MLNQLDEYSIGMLVLVSVLAELEWWPNVTLTILFLNIISIKMIKYMKYLLYYFLLNLKLYFFICKSIQIL